MSATRTEHDLVGDRELPGGCRYGIHTLRALENFPWQGPRIADVPEFSAAFGMVKLAALRANVECGVLDGELVGALERACVELIEDRADLRNGLVVPMLQGGAGTSTNMNVNEVLANRALELMGHLAGSYEDCHPNDHVNRSQSTNDVYPTALRVALALRGRDLVEPAMETLGAALRGAAVRFAGIPKLARTQLQDAVPMTVDQEVQAWADAVDGASDGLLIARQGICEVNLGGTAVGTGLTAPEGYRQRAVGHLAEISALPLSGAKRPVSATTDPSALLRFSGALQSGAIVLAKIGNDLRLLSSGPQTGLAEYRLPPLQAGSSMMPGKVNPVACEFVNQAAFRVRGLDAIATMALDAAQLQLNAMLPAVADALFEAQALLAAAASLLAGRCVVGMDVDERRSRSFAEAGLGGMTELAATVGYGVATAVALSADGERIAAMAETGGSSSSGDLAG
jgi:aspartate ammonia-lyase